MAKRISTVMAELEALGVSTSLDQLARILENPGLKASTLTTMSTPLFAESIELDNATETAKMVPEVAAPEADKIVYSTSSKPTPSDEPSEPAAPSGEAVSATPEKEEAMPDSLTVTIGKLVLPLPSTLTPETGRDVLTKLLEFRRFVGMEKGGRYAPQKDIPEDGLRRKGRSFDYNSIVEGDEPVKPSAGLLDRADENEADWPFVSKFLSDYIAEVAEVITGQPKQYWVTRKLMRGDITPQQLRRNVKMPASSGHRGHNREVVDNSIDPIEIAKEQERVKARRDKELPQTDPSAAVRPDLVQSLTQLIEAMEIISLDQLDPLMEAVMERHPDASDDDIAVATTLVLSAFEMEA